MAGCEQASKKQKDERFECPRKNSPSQDKLANQAGNSFILEKHYSAVVDPMAGMYRDYAFIAPVVWGDVAPDARWADPHLCLQN